MNAPRAPVAEGAAAGWLLWWRSRGPAMQAALPGAYAWAVTILPLGWAREAPPLAVAGTVLGALALVLGPLLEARAAVAGRVVLGWGLVASGLLTWVTSPDASARAFDAARGIAGMFGWGIFALAVASPVGQERSDAVPLGKPRIAKEDAVDRAVMLLGIGLAVALEVPGWTVEARDRALLVRLVAVGGGIGLITAASAVVVRVHARGEDAVLGKRARAWALVWAMMTLVLAGGGLYYWAARAP